MLSDILIKKANKKLFTLILLAGSILPALSQVPQNPAVNKDNSSDPLWGKGKLLEEVILRSGYQVRIVGDTTIYYADSFRLRKDAVTRELLKKLPGVQVSRSGQVTIMGEKISGITIDGEYFFSDNPLLILNQLPADMIKEIKVFEKTPEYAGSGADEVIKEKTIDLSLKKDQKNNMLAKAEASTNGNDLYNTSVLLSKIRSNSKLALFGMAGNTYDEKSGATDFDNSPSLNQVSGSALRDGGETRSVQSALQFNNTFTSGQKLNINMSSQWQHQKIGEETSRYDYLEDSAYTLKSNVTNLTSALTHSLNISYVIPVNSMNSVSIHSKLDVQKENNEIQDSATLIQGTNNLQNILEKKALLSPGSTDHSTSIIWKHMFKNPARSFSINGRLRSFKLTSDDFINNRNIEYSQGQAIASTETDQQVNMQNAGLDYDLSVTYTEPILPAMMMQINYAFINKNDRNGLETFEKSNTGKYTIPVDSLTNQFTRFSQMHRPGINLSVKKKNYSYGAGTSLVLERVIQKDHPLAEEKQFSFTRFSPNAFVTIRTKEKHQLKLNYLGISISPSARHLRPIIDNTDQLNQYQGNTNLKNAFRHKISAQFTSYNNRKQRGWWLNASYLSTQNGFVYDHSIINGKDIYTTVNASGNNTVSIWTNYNFVIPKLVITTNAGLNYTANQSIAFVNSQKVNNLNQVWILNLSFNKEKSEQYDITISPLISLTRNTNDLEPTDLRLKAGLNAEAGITFFRKIEFITSCNYEYYDESIVMNTKSFLLWNAGISRPIGKHGIKLFAVANDILDQQRNFERNYFDHYIEKRIYESRRSYFMAGIRWDIRSQNHH
jgi:hypothetical protein